jgi:hypothetical protein
MTTKNDITGDSIQTKSTSYAYRDGWERIFYEQRKQDELQAQMAKTCHEVIRALCQAFGDSSIVSWENAPQWQKDSTFEQIKFALANPDAPVSATHDSWSAEKIAAGWVYGPIKDADVKTHPCLVPFDDLPSDQKAKDYLFRAVVKSFT